MASRLCKTCKTNRTKNRVCATCAAAKTCARCDAPTRRGAQAKYCETCLPLVNTEQYHPKETRRVSREKQNWDADSYLGLTPDSHDWARLAAFIDGEGSIGLSPRKTPLMKSMTFCGKAVVTNTDFRLIVWCHETFGMPFSEAKRNHPVWKKAYHASAGGYRAAWILRNCLPWFLLKKQQAEIVLEHQRTTKVGTWNRGSGVSTPQDILQYRLALKQRLGDLNKRGNEHAIEAAKEA